MSSRSRRNGDALAAQLIADMAGSAPGEPAATSPTTASTSRHDPAADDPGLGPSFETSVRMRPLTWRLPSVGFGPSSVTFVAGPLEVELGLR